MIIKSSREYHAMVVGLFLIILATVLFLLDAGSKILFVVIVALLLLFIAMRFWIAIGRTLIFDSDGCTVKFMGICRTYKWEELITRHFVDMSNSFGYRQPYKSAAIFSAHQTQMPKWAKPGDYCVLMHPFSFIFVYFDPKTKHQKGDVRIPKIYLVEEELFRKQLAKWNVVLQERIR